MRMYSRGREGREGGGGLCVQAVVCPVREGGKKTWHSQVFPEFVPCRSSRSREEWQKQHSTGRPAKSRQSRCGSRGVAVSRCLGLLPDGEAGARRRRLCVGVQRDAWQDWILPGCASSRDSTFFNPAGADAGFARPPVCLAMWKIRIDSYRFGLTDLGRGARILSGNNLLLEGSSRGFGSCSSSCCP
jgi:hypothetical protein